MIRIQEPRQRIPERVTGGEALRRVRAQRLEDDAVERLRQVRSQLAQRWNLAVSNLHHHDMRRTIHGQPAAQQLIQHHAGGPDVRARIHVLSARLLWREEEVLALHHAGCRLEATQQLRLGDAEVDDLDLALVADEHVVRRDVAVDDAQLLAAAVRARVRVVQAPAHLHRDEDRHGDGQRRKPAAHRALEHLVERLAVDELHGEEVLALHLPEVEDLGDVAVGQRGGDARLADEHGDEGLVVRVLRKDLLDEHGLGDARRAHQLGMPRLRHAAPAQPGHQLIPSEGVPRVERHETSTLAPESQEHRIDVFASVQPLCRLEPHPGQGDGCAVPAASVTYRRPSSVSSPEAPSRLMEGISLLRPENHA
ncbi:hypothetical protein COEX109129_41800 [Corallococcus exiguus]